MLTFFQMLNKKTHFCSYSESVSLIQNQFLKMSGWALFCLLAAVATLFMKGFGTDILMRLSIVGVPLLMALVFGFLALRTYLLIITAQYRVITGECTSSPRGVNPFPKIKNFTRNLSYSFMMSDSGGLIVYVVVCPYAALPREGELVTIIVTPDAVRAESQTENLISSYIAMKCVAFKKPTAKAQQKKGKEKN